MEQTLMASKERKTPTGDWEELNKETHVCAVSKYVCNVRLQNNI